jgi:hypothetical protein
MAAKIVENMVFLIFGFVDILLNWKRNIYTCEAESWKLVSLNGLNSKGELYSQIYDS